MFTRKRGLFFCSELIHLNFECASPARQLAPRASFHGKHSRTCWTLPVTSCSCTCTSSLHGRNHPAGFTPSCRIPHHTCRQPRRHPRIKKKQTSQSEGFSTRAHVPLPSVTCTVHPANRTHRAGHVGFHTRAHVQNPSIPNSTTQPDLCPSAGSASHRVRFRTGS